MEDRLGRIFKVSAGDSNGKEFRIFERIFFLRERVSAESGRVDESAG